MPIRGQRGLTVNDSTQTSVAAALPYTKLGFKATLVALTVAGLLSATLARPAAAHSSTYKLNIPPEKLSDALQAFALASEHKLLYSSRLVEGLHSGGLDGEYTAEEAVARLLSGTGLAYRVTADSMVVIGPTAESLVENSESSRSAQTGKSRSQLSEGGKSFLDRFHLAQLDAGRISTVAPRGVSGRFGAEDRASGTSAEDKSTSSGRLEEIVVTSQKREENVQSVPISISAFTGSMLEQRGIENATDLQQVVPALTVTLLDRDQPNLSMRGVGLQNTTLGGDPGVTLYMDGHYLQAGGFLLQDYLDIERIEVQRGPQGTLYGRNSIGGNINIISKRPTEQLSGALSLDVGNYNKRTVQGAISGPLTERVRGRFAISDESRDGYVRNTAGPDLQSSDYTSMRGLVDVDLADDLLLSLGGYHYIDHGLLYGSVTAANPWRVSQNGPWGRTSTADGGSADLTWTLDTVELRSLSSFNKSRYELASDLDGTAAGTGAVIQQGHTKTFSQELQVVSNAESAVRWVAGLYYYDEESDFTFNVDSRPATFILQGPSQLDSKSMAAFGQADWSLTDELVLTAGVRYSHDKKDLASPLVLFIRNGVTLLPGGPGGDQSASFDAFTYRAALDYQLTPDAMLYASYSRGYKTGGFNPGDAVHPIYEPEYVNSFELGMKSDWFADRLQLNANAYYYDYKDKQDGITLINVALAYIGNAASLKAKGFELELLTEPVAGLQFNASASYIDAKYGTFVVLDTFRPVLGEIDIKGKTPPTTPDWKFGAGAQYKFTAGALGELTARVDYSYSGAYNFTYFERPQDHNPAYHIINARLGWRYGQHWAADLYGQNLEDENVIYTLFPTADGRDIPRYLPPRTYGLKVSYTF